MGHKIDCESEIGDGIDQESFLMNTVMVSHETEMTLTSCHDPLWPSSWRMTPRWILCPVSPLILCQPEVTSLGIFLRMVHHLLTLTWENYSAAPFVLGPYIYIFEWSSLCLLMRCNRLNFSTVPCPARSQPSAEFPAIPQPQGRPRRRPARCPATSPSASPSPFRLMTCCWARNWMELLHRRR